MYIPKDPKKYLKKAKEVVKTFKETGCDFEKTAEIHWFKNIRSVYRYLNYAGYKFSKRQRDKLGRYI